MRPQETIRVLIADDSATSRTQLELTLLATCELVGSAKNGRDAITMVAEFAPDVVLMDVHMPIMDGIEATRQISRKYPGTAVVLVSVDTDPCFVRKAMAAGARDYLAKPADPDEVLQVVQDTAEIVRDQRRLNEGIEERPGAGIWAFVAPSVGTQTLLTLGMASELANMGGEVAVVDLEPYFSSVSFSLGMGKSRRNLYNLQLANKQGGGFDPGDYFRNHSAGFQFLGPPADALDACRLDPAAMLRVVEEAARRFDYVLVEMPAGVPEAYFNVLDRAEYIFAAGEADPVGIKNFSILERLLRRVGYDTPRLRSVVMNEGKAPVKGFLEAAGVKPDLVLPRDEAAAEEAFRTGRPVTQCAPRSPLTRALRRYMIRTLEMPGEAEVEAPMPIDFLQKLVGWGG